MVKKNVPRHILAPRRGVRILAERFLYNRTQFPIIQKKNPKLSGFFSLYSLFFVIFLCHNGTDGA